MDDERKEAAEFQRARRAAERERRRAFEDTDRARRGEAQRRREAEASAEQESQRRQEAEERFHAVERARQDEARAAEERERLLEHAVRQEAEERVRAAEERRRLAQQGAERDRLARQEAEHETERDRLARQEAEQEAERDRLARQEAEHETERDRLARQEAEREAERDRLARKKAEQEAERDRLARQKAEERTRTLERINAGTYYVKLKEKWDSQNMTFELAHFYALCRENRPRVYNMIFQNAREVNNFVTNASRESHCNSVIRRRFWPTDIFGRRNFGQIAHLIPTSTSHASVYDDVATWALGLTRANLAVNADDEFWTAKQKNGRLRQMKTVKVGSLRLDSDTLGLTRFVSLSKMKFLTKKPAFSLFLLRVLTLSEIGMDKVTKLLSCRKLTWGMKWRSTAFAQP